MTRDRVVCQHVKDGLVTEVKVPYNGSHLLYETLRKVDGQVCYDSYRLHLPPDLHRSTLKDIQSKRTHFVMMGFPDGTGRRIGDPGSPMRDRHRRLPWGHIHGYVLFVRRADGQTRLIPGSYEYLSEIAKRIQETYDMNDRMHSRLYIGILVCSDPEFPIHHGLSDSHVPMPGYKEDWDILLKQELPYRRATR